MQVYPVDFFAGREFTVEPDLCFVIMPFAQPWSERTYTVVQEAVQELGMRCSRADDFYGKVVLSDIWQLINRAAFIVADLTDANPNVYYELGIAHTIGKDIIPLLQVGGNVPFDQQPFRILFYEDNRDGEAVLRSRLPKWIGSLSYGANPQMLMLRGHVAEFNSWRSSNEAPNLTRGNFKGIDVPGIDLSLAFLSESNFSEANFSEANLVDAILIRCILRQARFHNADLTKANLSEARLENANLTEANLRESILIRARLEGCDLTGADVGGATIDAFTLRRHRSQFETAIGVGDLVVESG